MLGGRTDEEPLSSLSQACRACNLSLSDVIICLFRRLSRCQPDMGCENLRTGLRAHRASNISPLPAWFRGNRDLGSAPRGGSASILPSPHTTHPKSFRALLPYSHFWKGRLALSPFPLLQGSSLGASSRCLPEGPGEPLSVFHRAEESDSRGQDIGRHQPSLCLILHSL